MCGIAGSFKFGAPSGPAELAVVSGLSNRQHHRGPDADGLFQRGSVVLAHRRLAIIDLSELGKQPMCNEDGAVWVTFNGEIYNYRELRSELTPFGHVFRSNSDTEILLHGYEQWGMEDLLRRLRGMFAFALYDARAEQKGGTCLYLARDRMGIKPLYYTDGPGDLLFASEVRPLRESAATSSLDRDAIAGFLCLGSVPSPRTYIRNIRSLPPASFLAVNRGGTQLSTYWSLHYGSEKARNLADLMTDTVDRHLLSDVPLGVFLSGGLDSGGLVGIMSRVRQTPPLTLTVTFPEAEFNEADAARKPAEAFGTQHIEVGINDADFLKEIPRILDAMDQPTADGVNTYFVSKAAHEAGLTVVLSGLGGDEIFFGYKHYRMLLGADLALRALAKMPGAARNALISGASWCGGRQSADRWERLGFLHNRPLGEGFYLLFRGFFGSDAACELLDIGEAELQQILESHFAAIRRPDDGKGWDINHLHFLEMQRYLHDQLLRDSDVFSMTHSLELRVPYLDHVLVEACAKIRGSEKLSRSVNKPLLLEAVGHPALYEAAQRKKRGFTFPFARWMREHAGPLEEVALSGGPLNPKAVRRCWARFRNGQAHWSRAWSTTVLAACATRQGYAAPLSGAPVSAAVS
jgi:asparagine synthase (glutamine-hydrolysing)